MPFTNIQHVILIVKSAKTVIEVVFKISLVGFGIPSRSSEYLLEVLFSVAVLLIVDPIADVVVAVGPYLPSEAISGVVGPPAFVECAVFPGVFALAVSNVRFLPDLALVVAICKVLRFDLKLIFRVKFCLAIINRTE